MNLSPNESAIKSLQANPGEYLGQYVAVHNGQIIAAGVIEDAVQVVSAETPCNGEKTVVFIGHIQPAGAAAFFADGRSPMH